MILEWSEEANDNLYDILYYIGRDDYEAAVTLDSDLHAAAESLLQFPFKGREGRIGGTRELIVRPRYILVYEVWPDKIFILSVLHTSWKWPYEQV